MLKLQPKKQEAAPDRLWSHLVDSLHLLNRTHNSPDFVRAMELISQWTEDAGFKGTSTIHAIPAGAEINFWRVPRRWSIQHFSLSRLNGEVIVDSSSHPLVLTPFSSSFTGKIGYDELLARINTHPRFDDAVPFVFRRMYRHWDEGWSLALSKNTVATLNDPEYMLRIETSFSDEPMPIYEYFIRGRSDKIIQLVAHLDHPGQCNDSLSGVVGALMAVRDIESRMAQPNFSYSVLATPEIVGSAVYLATKPDIASRIAYALAPNMLGHDAPVAICLSQGGDTQLDRALRLAAIVRNTDHIIGSWHQYPDCGDEISYDVPGINIPASTVSRIGEMFSYYHTSLDTPDKIKPDRFEEAVALIADALTYVDGNAIPVARFKGLPSLANPSLDLYLEPANLNNLPNPRMDRKLRDLRTGQPVDLRLLMEFFLSNLGRHATLLDIAYEYGVDFHFVRAYAEKFVQKGLIDLIDPVTETSYERRIRQTARGRSGKISL